MKFTLKGYQEEAVSESLLNLRKARKYWHGEGDRNAFSLTATTGAGKTVMAAAVFEALFHGDDNFDFETDPGAVVIWFSDDPSLNEQTRFRLLESSDRLEYTDLVVVENTFNREKFEPGKVYFLNTQKLGKKSLLVRGHDPDGDDSNDGGLFPETRPDMRSHTIWDTIQNTIDDPNLTLYLVLDEAHRGMGVPTTRAENEKSTIVKRLINGSGAVPAIPIVWGISATVDRFDAAMKEMSGRGTLPNVVVDSAKVQESGLLKDTIILDIPDEVGQFDTVLVRRATRKIVACDKAWKAYADQQDDAELVEPLMVLQVPNTPNGGEVGQAIDTILQNWPDITGANFAHVFGEHKAQTFGGHTVEYISPENVQDQKWVRVLIAKDAISTGWDCPRAEVMVSFRAAQDPTHITQLMGRMVRTPLARRIPSNDRLNAVYCLLPFFNVENAKAVVKALQEGGEGEGALTGRRILINPAEMHPNPSVPEAVWEKFESLPSQSLPKKAAKPVKRLTALAQELATDSLLPDAGKKAHAAMHKVLNAAQKSLAAEIKKARQDVIDVEGITLKAGLVHGGMSLEDFLEEADYVVIMDAFRRAARGLSPDVAKTYAEHLAAKKKDADPEEALIEAYTDIAALGLVPKVQETLDEEADKLAQTWLEEYNEAIKGLSDDRKDAYRQVKGWSQDPQDIDMARPDYWMEETAAREESGDEANLPTYEHHLLSDENGNFPAELNEWERKVLKNEMQRDGFKAWYRNPSWSSQDSLGIAYEFGGDYKIVRPDFIVFAKDDGGEIVADIIDPHGTYLADALPKIQGTAAYAETHPSVYRRVESVAKVDNKYKLLDLKDPAVRKKANEVKEAEGLYKSDLARDY